MIIIIIIIIIIIVIIIIVVIIIIIMTKRSRLLRSSNIKRVVIFVLVPTARRGIEACEHIRYTIGVRHRLFGSGGMARRSTRFIHCCRVVSINVIH
jgi:hypothetical protein